MKGIPKLKPFLVVSGLPGTEQEIVRALRHESIVEVRHFVLGPATSNIPQACRLWCERTGLAAKSTQILGPTPDVYIKDAMDVTEPGVVPLVWTCAVYGREPQLFFGYPNMLMFFVQQTMALDHMQLAARDANLGTDVAGLRGRIIEELWLPRDWKLIASHLSPRYLLDSLLGENPHCQWRDSTSNGQAAIECRRGEVQACITTETARQENGLTMIFDFGCPPMVFFGGLTEHGAAVVAAAWAAFKRGKYERELAAAASIEEGDLRVLLG